MIAVWVVGAFLSLVLYLWHANRAIQTAPSEVLKLCQEGWTKQEIEEAYRKAQTSPTDVKPYLFAKKNRRYVVVGGSGLVGGWIVHHLMMRGEDPAAIRIIDLSPTTRQEAIKANINFVKADVSDLDQVIKAFNKPWPDHVKSLPLTVFHCVAYINPSDRTADNLPIYVKVNVLGTENVLHAAKASGASCFVATSSGSIGLTPPNFFPLPWQRWSASIYQFLPNADRKDLNAPLEQFGSCYAWSKAQAEKIVCDANDPKANFRTGCIRPGHAIYGHGVENRNSLTWDYLRRGGSPTWIADVVTQFVCAQNVSIGHLAYENALLINTNPGGKGYLVTDPNPPMTYQHLYSSLSQLAHPLTPVAFRPIPFMPMLLLGYIIEAYSLLGKRYLHFLPPVTGDIAYVQPAQFHMCTLHLVYTDTAAQKEIGYRAPITTKEGFALAVLDWNRKVEERMKMEVEMGKGGEMGVREANGVPKPPNVH